MSCVYKFTVYIKWNSADLVVEATAKKMFTQVQLQNSNKKSTQFDESKNKKHFSDINITNRSFFYIH